MAPELPPAIHSFIALARIARMHTLSKFGLLSLVLFDFKVVVEMIFDDPVTFAGTAFKASAIKYVELSSTVLDQLFILEMFGGDADRRTIVAEHVCEVLMSQRHGVWSGAISAEE